MRKPATVRSAETLGRVRPRRRITSYVAPRGLLTRPGMANHEGDHSGEYPGFPALADA